MPGAMETVMSYLFHCSQGKSKTLVPDIFRFTYDTSSTVRFAHLFNTYLPFYYDFSFKPGTAAFYYST